MSTTPPTASPSTTNIEPAASPSGRASPNVRYLASGLPRFVRARDLNQAAREAGIPARYDMGRTSPSMTRIAFVITKTVEENAKAQAFLQKYLNENWTQLAEEASKSPRDQFRLDLSAPPTIGFAKLPPRPQKRRQASPKSSSGSESVDAKAVDRPEKTDEKKPRNPRAPRARAPQSIKVPRDDAVYVQVQGKTTVDELRGLLSDFPSVEVKLRHVRRKYHRANQPKDLAEAIVTVGSEHQQKALDTLTGKELHGHTLQPVPSYRKQPLNASESETSPEEQTSVEHVE